MAAMIAHDESGTDVLDGPGRWEAANQGFANRTGVQSPEPRTSQTFAENCKWRFGHSDFVFVNSFRMIVSNGFNGSKFPQLNQQVTAFFSGAGCGDMVEDF